MTSLSFSTVAQHFADESAYWATAYASSDVTSAIYQERLARSLAWTDRLHIAHGARALDVGTGGGQAAVALAERGWQVEAIDGSRVMADLAYQHAVAAGVSERVQAEQGNAQELRYADGAFQLVFALGVLPWVENQHRALAEMARVVQPDGYVIVSFANRNRLTYRLDPLHSQELLPIKRPLRRWLEGRGRWPSGRPEPALHSAHESHQLLADVGLQPLQSASFGFGPFTLLGRRVFSQRSELWLQRHLQAIRILRGLGTEYLILARQQA